MKPQLTLIGAYRKKPIVITAFHYQGQQSNFDLMRWASTLNACDGLGIDDDGECSIYTPEGTMYVSQGDYIICGVMGELYPCKPNIFEASYEPV